MGRLASAALTALLLALALAPAHAQQEQEPEPVFRVDVRLVRMLATVKSPMGALVGGLEKSDFKVFDNDVEQEIALFERRTEQPLSIAVLVDTSRSTERERRYELDSIRRFLQALLREGNEADEAALYSFNTDVTLHTDYTRDLRRLERGLRSLVSKGATAMYDSIFLAAEQMKRRDGRHVVLIVSDGADTASRVKFENALEALHEVDAVLYAVLVTPVRGSAGRNLRGENALATYAQWTGGRIFTPALGAGIDNAFDEILRDLRTQYLLGFYPRGVSPAKERFHRVRLEVNRPGHSVGARNGYFSDDVIEPPPSGGPRRQP
jgi:Ca-activated chloride channel homolog